MGGAIFHFSQKIGLKSTKNMRFCILHKPMGGARAPPAPPLATLLTYGTYYVNVKKKSRRDFFVFGYEFLLFFHINYTRLVPSLRGGSEGPSPPPNDCLCSQFWLTQNTFLKHHVPTRQQAIIEKEIITFKHNSRLKFSRFFAKLLATNCCT